MPTTDLMAALLIDEVSLRPPPQQEISSQADGRTRFANLGPSLWRGSISCSTMDPEDLEAALALIGSIEGTGGTFYVWHPAKQYPRRDGGGVILGASTVQINSLGIDNKSLSLKGLPNGYVLSRGDLLSFDYLTSPTYRALHQVVPATITANGSGVTAEFEVHPHIEPGAATNAAVSLIRAAAEMMIVPGSINAKHIPDRGSLAFDILQV